MKLSRYGLLIMLLLLICSYFVSPGSVFSQTTIDDVELGDDPEGDGAGDGAPSGASTGVSDEAVARVPNAADTDVDATDFQKMSATIGGPNIETIINLDGAVSSTNLLLEWSERIGATAYNIYRDTEAYFVADRGGGSNRIATGVTDEDGGTAGVQWTDTGSAVGDAATQHFYVATGTDDLSNEAFNSNRAGEYDFDLGTGFNFITAPLTLAGITDAEDLGLAIDSQVGGDGANAIYRMTGGSWELMAFKSSGVWVLTVTDAIVIGQAYLVNMNDAGNWTAAGMLLSDLTYSLGVGFNTIMLKFKQAGDEAIVDAEDLGLSIDANAAGDGASAIYRMVSGSWELMAFKSSGVWVLTVTDAVVPGQAYLINMDESLDW